MGAALVGRLIDLLGVLGLGLGDQPHVLEHGQGRIDDARARRIFAAGHLLDRADQLIAVARLVGDQLKQHEAKLAALEHPLAVAAAAPPPAAPTCAVVEVEIEIERPEAERATAPAGMTLVPAMFAAIIMEMHRISPFDSSKIYLRCICFKDGCNFRRSCLLLRPMADLFADELPPELHARGSVAPCAAGRPAAARVARRGGRAGASDRPGRRDRADGRGGQAQLDDPVGAARNRQDQHCPAAGRRGRTALRRHVGGVLRRRRPQEDLRRGEGRGESRAAHPAVRGRDPPLQPLPAGRLPALCRGRHDHAGRRDDRKPQLRAQRRAAVALPGADPPPARQRCACASCSSGPRSWSDSRCH